ncbi:putative encoded peptide [Helianthus annuus]|nr:putative encoded peptide [Helianthus annuus]
MSMLTLCMLILLVPYNIPSIEASKGRKILPPPMPTQTPPAPKPPRAFEFKANRFKKYETRGFRPTCPGPSPGVGHGNPPGC